jgi:hypothetical protein
MFLWRKRGRITGITGHLFSSFKACRSHTEPFFHAVGVGFQAYDLRMLQDAVVRYRIS